MYSTQGGAGGRYNKFQYGGYELALKYNVLSPYKDEIGLSFGVGFEDRDQYRLDGADIDQKSYTATIYVQKNWMDNLLSVAGNFKTEFERRKSPGVLEEEIAFDMSAGVSYRVAPKHYIGLEFRRQVDHLNPYEEGVGFDTEHDNSEFDLGDFQLGSRHQYGQYLGPTYHYAEKEWWFTTGILFQINGGGSKNAFNKSGRNFDEHEEMHIGFIVGYEF